MAPPSLPAAGVEFVPPPFVPGENLLNWVEHSGARDQFVARYNDETVIWWNDPLCPADARWGLDEPERQWLCQRADGGDESELAAPAQRVIGCLRLGAAARRRPTARHGLRRAPPGLATQSIALWVEDPGL